MWEPAAPAAPAAAPADSDPVVDLTMCDDSETESSESDDSDDSDDMWIAYDDDDDSDDDDQEGATSSSAAAASAAPSAVAVAVASAVAPAVEEGKVETRAASKEACLRVETKTSELPRKWDMAYTLLRVGWQHGFRVSHQSESRRFAYVAARYFAQMRAGKDKDAIRRLDESLLSDEEKQEVVAYYLWHYM